MYPAVYPGCILGRIRSVFGIHMRYIEIHWDTCISGKTTPNPRENYPPSPYPAQRSKHLCHLSGCSRCRTRNHVHFVMGNCPTTLHADLPVGSHSSSSLCGHSALGTSTMRPVRPALSVALSVTTRSSTVTDVGAGACGAGCGRGVVAADDEARSSSSTHSIHSWMSSISAWRSSGPVGGLEAVSEASIYVGGRDLVHSIKSYLYR